MKYTLWWTNCRTSLWGWSKLQFKSCSARFAISQVSSCIWEKVPSVGLELEFNERMMLCKILNHCKFLLHVLLHILLNCSVIYFPNLSWSLLIHFRFVGNVECLSSSPLLFKWLTFHPKHLSVMTELCAKACSFFFFFFCFHLFLYFLFPFPPSFSSNPFLYF